MCVCMGTRDLAKQTLAKCIRLDDPNALDRVLCCFSQLPHPAATPFPSSSLFISPLSLFLPSFSPRSPQSRLSFLFLPLLALWLWDGWDSFLRVDRCLILPIIFGFRSQIWGTRFGFWLLNLFGFVKGFLSGSAATVASSKANSKLVLQPAAWTSSS